jgi:type IV pilus assembly protein PilF
MTIQNSAGRAGGFVGLCALLLVLSGCITERVGNPIPDASLEEAANLNLQLGISYLRQNYLQTARRKLDKAIEQNPDLVMAYTILGLVYERQGDTEAAGRYYRKAVALSPRDPDALNSLAIYLCQTSKGRPEAMGLFNRALAVPLSKQYSNKAMLNTNAGMCVKQDDLPLAEKYLRAALASDPGFSDALRQMAGISYQQGNFLQSRGFLQRYMSVDEVSPSVLWLAIEVETAMGDTQAADEFGRQLKRDFPGSAEARRLLERERNAGI